MQNTALDTIDRRLLHALQVEPRASWNSLAPIIGVDAGTLARHWKRLTDEGLAWVTGYSADRQLSLVEIQCEQSHRAAIAERLRNVHEVFVLDHTSGARDLIALVLWPGLEQLSSFLLSDLPAIEGIRAAHTHLAGETFIEGGGWRLRELSSAEVARIPPPRRPRARGARQVPREVRDAILHEIWADGRVPVSTIAERSGISPQRIADGLATLRRDGAIRLRTDLARETTEWPIYTWYFIEAPSTVIEAARNGITSVPEVRLAFTSASRYNLILAVWLRRLADVNRFELALERALEGARIADRAVVFRTERHMNRLLGQDTRAIGAAPG